MSIGAARQLGDDNDLSIYGISNVAEVIQNPSFELLHAEEMRDDLEGFERATMTTRVVIVARSKPSRSSRISSAWSSSNEGFWITSATLLMP